MYTNNFKFVIIITKGLYILHMYNITGDNDMPMKSVSPYCWGLLVVDSDKKKKK